MRDLIEIHPMGGVIKNRNGRKKDMVQRNYKNMVNTIFPEKTFYSLFQPKLSYRQNERSHRDTPYVINNQKSEL